MIWKYIIGFEIFATIWSFASIIMVTFRADHILEIKGYGSSEFSFMGLIMAFIICSIPMLNILIVLGVFFNTTKIVDYMVESEIKNYEQ